jgi:hypothetical protein
MDKNFIVRRIIEVTVNYEMNSISQWSHYLEKNGDEIRYLLRRKKKLFSRDAYIGVIMVVVDFRR